MSGASGDEWTKEEDEHIKECAAMVASNVMSIYGAVRMLQTDFMPGRSVESIRRRLYLIRRKLKSESDQSDKTS